MEAKSSWICESERELSSVIVELHQFPERDNTEFLALLDEEKCISLRKPPNSPNLDCSIIIDASNNFIKTKGDREIPNSSKTPKIQINKDGIKCEVGEANSSRMNSPFPTACLPESSYLTEILILSEAKFVETFLNSYQEYYKTFQSTLISQFEDSHIYKTVIEFQKPEVSVLLKLKGLFCEDSLWIYGIFIKTNLNSQTNILPTVPIASNQRSCDIDVLIREKGVSLSEKAEKFKKLYQICNGAQAQSPMYLTDALSTFSLLNRQEDKDAEFKVFQQMMGSEKEKLQDKAVIREDLLHSPKQPRVDSTTEGMDKMLGKLGEIISSTSSVSGSEMPPSLQALLNSLPKDSAKKSCQSPRVKSPVPSGSLSPYMANDKVSMNQNDQKAIESAINHALDRKFHEFEKRMEYNMNKSQEMIHKRLENIEFLLKNFIDMKWDQT